MWVRISAAVVGVGDDSEYHQPYQLIHSCVERNRDLSESLLLFIVLGRLVVCFRAAQCCYGISVLFCSGGPYTARLASLSCIREGRRRLSIVQEEEREERLEDMNSAPKNVGLILVLV